MYHQVNEARVKYKEFITNNLPLQIKKKCELCNKKIIKNYHLQNDVTSISVCKVCFNNNKLKLYNCGICNKEGGEELYDSNCKDCQYLMKELNRNRNRIIREEEEVRLYLFELNF